MKIIAFLLLVCITGSYGAALVNSSHALRRIKRSPPPLANATKLAEDFVELRTGENDANPINLKQEHQTEAAAAIEPPANFQEGNIMHLRNKLNENTNTNNNNDGQQLDNNNNNNNNGQQQHLVPKQEQRSLHLGNSALAYLLQNKANHKQIAAAEQYTGADGAAPSDITGDAAELVLIGGGGGKMRSPFRDMRGSIACNAKKIANLNTNRHNLNNNNDDNSRCGGNYIDNNKNNNFNINNGNPAANNNHLKISAFNGPYKNSNYNKNNNYDAETKPLTETDQMQLEAPMHQEIIEAATCPAPTQQSFGQQQQQQQQPQQQQQQQKPNFGQGSVVFSFSSTGTGGPETNNMKNLGKQNNMNRYESMENVLQLANMLLYKLVDKLGTKVDKLKTNNAIYNLPPFRTGGTQIFLTPNANSPPVAFPDMEDLDPMDYILNPIDNAFHGGPAATVTTASPMPISLPLLPPLLFQSQFALHEPSAQPINLIETALDKLLATNGIENEDSDGDELELRCPIHQTIKRNGTSGNNVKDDVIQVCSCRFFKKKKNT